MALNTLKVNHKWMVRTAVLFLMLSSVYSVGIQAKEKDKPILTDRSTLTVLPSNRAKAVISPERIVREELPSTLFGFNIRWTGFENDLWDEKKQEVKSDIIDDLREFPGALYRYPGGTVANTFQWEDAVGPIEERKKYGFLRDRVPQFGIEEYFRLLGQVKGKPFYVLNLMGEAGGTHNGEVNTKKVARSNAALAEYIKSIAPGDITSNYYQLGNELDRNKYEWSTDKYITNSLATINAIQAVDSNAKFVAFLRDFNWRYRGAGKSGVSRYGDFVSEVLQGLPMVRDFSLHYYYDGSLGRSGSYLHISKALDKIVKVLDVANNSTSNRGYNVWITEHSRRIVVDSDNREVAKRLTTNLGAAIGVADFLIGVAQIPEVKGACLQALNGVARQVFDASIKHRDLRPLPVYWAKWVLHQVEEPIVMATQSFSPNTGGYEGGYDVRTVAFTDPDQKNLGLWVVNRASRSMPIDIHFEAMKGDEVVVIHYYIAGQKSVDPDSVDAENYELQSAPTPESKKFSNEGIITLNLPPNSVSAFRIAQEK